MAIKGKNKERQRSAADAQHTDGSRRTIPIESEDDTRADESAPQRPGDETAESPQAPTESAASGDPSTPGELAAELAQWKDKFLRAKADGQNALRRAAAERDDAIRYGNARLLRSLLDVVDDLDRTLEAADQSEDAGALSEGVRLIRDKMQALLASEGVKPIEATGQPFDPNRHEAMMQQPSKDYPAGTVLQQVQRGYMHHDRVLRPAKVIIASSPPEVDSSDEPDES